MDQPVHYVNGEVVENSLMLAPLRPQPEKSLLNALCGRGQTPNVNTVLFCIQAVAGLQK